MSTLLVNPKMNPALAARVQASVTGHRGPRLASHSIARWRSWVRLCLVTGIAWLAVSIAISVRRERAELARSRAMLLAQWRTQSASITPKEATFLDRAERVVSELRTADLNDLIVDQLRTPGSFTQILERRAVYLRGPVAMLDGATGAIARAAADSGKDTLLLCLIDPPAARDEKTLLAKARFTMASGTPFLEHTHSVLRLNDAEVGLPILLDGWSERIRTAKDAQSLLQIEREFKRAPLTACKRALESELLIAVLDEPGDKGSVTELDGEAPHAIRLAIIELDSRRTLLRLRRHVDPSWVSSHRRPQYARELDGCRFALDVHDAVRRAPAQ